MKKLMLQGLGETANKIQLLPQEGPGAAGANKHIWGDAVSPSHFDRSQHTGIPGTSTTPAHSMICLLKPVNLPIVLLPYSN